MTLLRAFSTDGYADSTTISIRFTSFGALVAVPIIRVGSIYADADFGFLGRHLKLLDIELVEISAAIKTSRDPESDGLLDAGEYFIGHGFVAIQRYMTTVCVAAGMGRHGALKLGPRLENSVPFAALVNAGANYWKHIEEWFERAFDGEGLQKSAMRTIAQIEAVTVVTDYTCANIMALLPDGQKMVLSALLPYVAEWRGSVFDENTAVGRSET